MALFELYAVAAAFNNYSLTNLVTVKPTGDNRYFCFPEGYANFTPGVRKRRLNSRLFYAGYPMTYWLFGILTRFQYEYLRDTYCGGLYDGEVTVLTRTDRVAYSYYNAILEIPELTSVQRHFRVFEDFPIKLLHLIEIDAPEP